MLPKFERFNTTDLSKLKGIKFKKIIVKYGFFVVYEAIGNKKGVILSKKNFKTAVLRNKYKRLFYNTVSSIPSLKNKSFIMHPKKVFTKEGLLKDLLEIK